MYLYVLGDFDIYANTNTWECGEYTHFVIAMNVSLLAVHARESEICPVGCQKVRERKLSKAHTK